MAMELGTKKHIFCMLTKKTEMICNVLFNDYRFWLIEKYQVQYLLSAMSSLFYVK